MGFTAAEDAKPKEPHPEGLKCRSCGAETASEWRGPAPKEFCSKGKCRKAAAAAHKALKGASWEDKLKEIDDDVAEMDERLQDLAATVERRTQRHADQLEKQAAQLQEQQELIASLQTQVARLASFVHNAPAPGAKRPALSGLSAPRAQQR